MQTLLTVAQGVSKRRAQVAVASTRNRVPVLNAALRAGCVPAGGAGAALCSGVRVPGPGSSLGPLSVPWCSLCCASGFACQ